MQNNLRQELLKTATRWFVCFLIIGGFMFYHSSAPLVPIIVAGLVTLALMEAMTYYEYSQRKPR